MSITWSIFLIISIITYFWNWNNHFDYTYANEIEILEPGQNIFALQFLRLSPKFWKIVDFKSTISPLLELQIRWFFLNCVFLKEEFRSATCFSWICIERFKKGCESHCPILPLFSPKKNSHLCQGKCSDTRCGEPPTINNENAKILEHKRYFIDHGPLQGENLLWASSIQNNSSVLSIASTHTYILSLI